MEFLTGADRSKSAPAMRKTVASNAPDKSSSGSANSPGVRPPRATSSAILATVEENNYGITWDDHHDANGASPPAKHKALYDFLPRLKFQVKDDDDMRAESVQMIREAKREAANKQIPKSIVVEMSHSDDPLSTQRLQARVMGVYNLIRASVEKAKPPAPVWKHAREDLVLLQGDVDGEKGWIIALSTSLHNDSKPKVCARVHGAELPHVGSGKQQRIQAWDPYKGKWLWVNDVSAAQHATAHSPTHRTPSLAGRMCRPESCRLARTCALYLPHTHVPHTSHFISHRF